MQVGCPKTPNVGLYYKTSESTTSLHIKIYDVWNIYGTKKKIRQQLIMAIVIGTYFTLFLLLYYYSKIINHIINNHGINIIVVLIKSFFYPKVLKCVRNRQKAYVQGNTLYQFIQIYQYRYLQMTESSLSSKDLDEFQISHRKDIQLFLNMFRYD